MTAAYATTLRNARLNLVRDAIDAGVGAGLLRIYGGSRPSTGGAATTLLAELPFTDPSAGGAAGGVLTMSAITTDAEATATGNASWFRVVDSDALFVMDGNVGISGAQLNLNTVSIVLGAPVSVSGFVVTGGNA